MTQTWCVVTETSKRYLLDYSGNGGFGPVNVWDNGKLVPVRYRHRLGDLSHCDTCIDPLSAQTYLPMQSWETPDPTRTGQPGSGDSDRGAFTAFFSGGPDYPGQPFRAHVSRRNWWRYWERHSIVELDPQGDWRTAFDDWRQLATGYQPDSGWHRSSPTLDDSPPVSVVTDQIRSGFTTRRSDHAREDSAAERKRRPAPPSRR